MKREEDIRNNSTYMRICEKLGFDILNPDESTYPYRAMDYEDDSQVNPASLLTHDEKIWVMNNIYGMNLR